MKKQHLVFHTIYKPRYKGKFSHISGRVVCRHSFLYLSFDAKATSQSLVDKLCPAARLFSPFLWAFDFGTLAVLCYMCVYGKVKESLFSVYILFRARDYAAAKQSIHSWLP